MQKVVIIPRGLGSIPRGTKDKDSLESEGEAN